MYFGAGELSGEWSKFVCNKLPLSALTLNPRPVCVQCQCSHVSGDDVIGLCVYVCICVYVSVCLCVNVSIFWDCCYGLVCVCVCVCVCEGVCV